MTVNAIGDLAQSFLLRRQTVQARQEIGVLTEELTTGRVSNPFSNVSGDYSYVADIERSLGLNGGYRTAVAEAAVFTDGMQVALARVQDTAALLSRTIFDATSGDLAEVYKLPPRAAADALEEVVAALNTRVADRSLFSGQEINQPALADAASILTDLKGAISLPVTADGLRDAVNQWFDGPGFATSGYLGATVGLEPYRLGRDSVIDLDLRADSPALRDAVKHIALAVLASDPAFGLSVQDKTRVLRESAAQLSATEGGLIGLRADLGFAQDRIEESKVRLYSERSSLEIARNSLLSVDPFEAATKLQDAQSRLESLYAVTVRLSRLSLSEFMR